MVEANGGGADGGFRSRQMVKALVDLVEAFVAANGGGKWWRRCRGIR
jgi:hypothetical protein